ncbi:hypothetical protein HII31_13245 [Pseudocercospora fuligena]|uniref:Uncharacterized protein n=1 Tax=Pseudocercospora fuligena TaxID=685502 RepID=A0A8H6VAT9_9PEZI|nr:hypothetical protein HII31_13245 [Pseudocercospora fuligena]
MMPSLHMALKCISSVHSCLPPDPLQLHTSNKYPRLYHTLPNLHLTRPCYHQQEAATHIEIVHKMPRKTRSAETAGARNVRRNKAAQVKHARLNSIATRVFSIPELLEHILLLLTPTRIVGGVGFRPQLQLFALQRVNRTFLATILGSKQLQAAMTTPPRSSWTSGEKTFYQIGDEYGPGFSAALKRAMASAEVPQETWRRIKFNPRPDELFFLAEPGRPEEQTYAETTWGDAVEWYHKGGPLRNPQGEGRREGDLASKTEREGVKTA